MEVSFGVNTVLTGKVQKVERFGVILELEENVTGLIPNSELGTQRGTDHFRMFPVNTEIEVKVLEIDKKRRRISLSRKALLNHDEEQAFADYKKNAEVPKSLGSFEDLLSKHLKKAKHVASACCLVHGRRFSSVVPNLPSPSSPASVMSTPNIQTLKIRYHQHLPNQTNQLYRPIRCVFQILSAPQNHSTIQT